MAYTENKQLYSGTVTANGNSYSAPIEVNEYREAIIYVHITARVSGKINLWLMHQDTISEVWYSLNYWDKLETVEAFTPLEITSCLGSKMAIKWTIEGATDMTLEVNGSFKS